MRQSVRRKEAQMTDRDTLEEDLDRVLVGLAPEPVGEWDWEPPLGSAIPASPAVSAEPSEPEDESEDESDQEQDSQDDA
jgi:hypothetical protein